MSSYTRQPVLLDELHTLQFIPAAPPQAAVLVVSPLFEEKRCAHRALTACAQALAAAGALVMQVDLSATGNSSGALTDCSLARWTADLHTAACALRTNGDLPCRLLAFRAGALLAMQAITPELCWERLILCQPVLAGKSYLRQLRTRRMIQDSVSGQQGPDIDPHEIEGQLVAPALLSDLEALVMPAAPPPGDLHLVQCSFNDKLLTEYARLCRLWGDDRVQQRNLVVEPFWNAHSPSQYHLLTRTLVEEVMG